MKTNRIEEYVGEFEYNEEMLRGIAELSSDLFGEGYESQEDFLDEDEIFDYLESLNDDDIIIMNEHHCQILAASKDEKWLLLEWNPDGWYLAMSLDEYLEGFGYDKEYISDWDAELLEELWGEEVFNK